MLKRGLAGVLKGSGNQLWLFRQGWDVCFFLWVPSSQRWIFLVLLLKAPLVVELPTLSFGGVKMDSAREGGNRVGCEGLWPSSLDL